MHNDMSIIMQYFLGSIFTTLKILCAPPVRPTPHTQPLETTDLFIVSTVLTFPECHILGLVSYVAFSDWLFAHSNIHLINIHVFSSGF